MAPNGREIIIPIVMSVFESNGIRPRCCIVSMSPIIKGYDKHQGLYKLRYWGWICDVFGTIGSWSHSGSCELIKTRYNVLACIF